MQCRSFWCCSRLRRYARCPVCSSCCPAVLCTLSLRRPLTRPARANPAEWAGDSDGFGSRAESNSTVTMLSEAEQTLPQMHACTAADLVGGDRCGVDDGGASLHGGDSILGEVEHGENVGPAAQRQAQRGERGGPAPHAAARPSSQCRAHRVVSYSGSPPAACPCRSRPLLT